MVCLLVSDSLCVYILQVPYFFFICLFLVNRRLRNFRCPVSLWQSANLAQTRASCVYIDMVLHTKEGFACLSSGKAWVFALLILLNLFSERLFGIGGDGWRKKISLFVLLGVALKMRQMSPFLVCVHLTVDGFEFFTLLAFMAVIKTCVPFHQAFDHHRSRTKLKTRYKYCRARGQPLCPDASLGLVLLRRPRELGLKLPARFCDWPRGLGQGFQGSQISWNS